VAMNVLVVGARVGDHDREAADLVPFTEKEIEHRENDLARIDPRIAEGRSHGGGDFVAPRSGLEELARAPRVAASLHVAGGHRTVASDERRVELGDERRRKYLLEPETTVLVELSGHVGRVDLVRLGHVGVTIPESERDSA